MWEFGPKCMILASKDTLHQNSDAAVIGRWWTCLTVRSTTTVLDWGPKISQHFSHNSAILGCPRWGLTVYKGLEWQQEHREQKITGDGRGEDNRTEHNGTENNRRQQQRRQTWAEKKEEKQKKCSSTKPTSWRRNRRRRRRRRGRGVASRQGDYGCRLPPHGVGGCDAACRWGATQAAVLPGPGSLTEPILLPVPLASPGPRHPAGPSALQPQRSTAARHSTPGPAPLLMHMQPYSGLYSHSQTHQQQTHTSTTKETMRNGSLPPPFTVSTTGLDQNTH